MHVSQDGSAGLYFATQPPAGQDASWIPTDRTGRFEVLFRSCGPTGPPSGKTWQLPDIGRI